jgi:hypothetical protein
MLELKQGVDGRDKPGHDGEGEARDDHVAGNVPWP